MGRVHQHFTLVPAMTVAENVVLGGRGLLRNAEMMTLVAEIASRTGFRLDPHARVESLPVGAKQRVEIAKAVARNPSVLILDEPTAALAPSEIEDLLQWIRQYVRSGASVVLITHKLSEALAIADEVTAMRRGAGVFRAPARDVSVSQLARAMIGADPDMGDTSRRPAQVTGRSVVFEAELLRVADEAGRVRVGDASFRIRCGGTAGRPAAGGAGRRRLPPGVAGPASLARRRLLLPAAPGARSWGRHPEPGMVGTFLVQRHL